jgi:hypothetical protein
MACPTTSRAARSSTASSSTASSTTPPRRQCTRCAARACAPGPPDSIPTAVLKRPSSLGQGRLTLCSSSAGWPLALSVPAPRPSSPPAGVRCGRRAGGAARLQRHHPVLRPDGYAPLPVCKNQSGPFAIRAARAPPEPAFARAHPQQPACTPGLHGSMAEPVVCLPTCCPSRRRQDVHDDRQPRRLPGAWPHPARRVGAAVGAARGAGPCVVATACQLSGGWLRVFPQGGMHRVMVATAAGCSLR